jgi:hypothetical protein
VERVFVREEVITITESRAIGLSGCTTREGVINIELWMVCPASKIH